MFELVIIIVKLNKIFIPFLPCQCPAGVPCPEDRPAILEVIELVGIAPDLILGEYKHIIPEDTLILRGGIVLIIDYDECLSDIPMPLEAPEAWVYRKGIHRNR